MKNAREMTRRQLLKALGGGLLIAAAAQDVLAMNWAQRGRPGSAIPQEISAWLHIGPDGKVTIFTGKVEVGQNARTSLTQAAAEELRVHPSDVSVVMGDTDLTPFDMGTFGSRTTPTMVPQVRRAAAEARQVLTNRAARLWNVDPKGLTAEAGLVSASGKSTTYGELAKGMPISEQIDPDVLLTPPETWGVLGTSVPKIHGEEIVTGKHRYTVDLRREGMLHAVVLRPPSFGATMSAVDLSGAEGLADVKVVHDRDFVAVAAPTKRLALRALAEIKATWKETPTGSSQELVSLIRGSAAIAAVTLPPSAKPFQATYTCAYIAHVPLEPRAALAEWDGQKMTVHTGTQRPFGVKEEIVSALGLPAAQVRVIVPDTGSGYGGKHTGEAAVEAARIAKSLGRTVKVVWSRAEEFTWAYFRPAGVVEISSGIDPSGRLVAWQHDNFNSGPPGIGTPYEVPDPRTEFHEAPAPLRQGSYRALAATFNNFARESHMDELALLAGIDPVEFRIRNLKDERLKAVLQAAAERFGWGKEKPAKGHGFGIACGTEKGGFIATAAEVSADPDSKAVRVIRVVSAFECGAILNPDHLLNQVNGAVIMGIGGALFEAIHFKDGKIQNPHLSLYRVPRYTDVPKLDTILLNRKDLPSAGAGECPIIGIAPAIGNALFAATGNRVRSMPLAS